MDISLIPTLLCLAWLLPLASFTLILFLGPRMGKGGSLAAYVATGAIMSAGVLSFLSLFIWLGHFGAAAPGEHHAAVTPASSTNLATVTDSHPSLAVSRQTIKPVSFAAVDAKADAHADHDHGSSHAHHANVPNHLFGEWYTLGKFGKLSLSIGYYVDALTVGMFCMVTFIATCIHFYASGYMHDELHDITDHEVTLTLPPHKPGHDSHGHDDHGHGSHGHDTHAAAHHDDHGHSGHGHDDHGHGNHLHRPGRFHRFFQYLSLFCFSMLGIVISGNIAMTFVFWELVGICSYFLIGFYVERKSASTAANKAFITNRVGDFGMIIGLMAIWSTLGTFNFGDLKDADGHVTQAGIFSQVRTAENDHAIATPDGMVLAELAPKVADELKSARDPLTGQPVSAEYIQSVALDRLSDARSDGLGYWLLVVAGVGIFCGCVGKSAQFPLHTWLPDAMEGPTPVSALVHSATMVAAGVYLVGRFYPVFTPEVLLVIAYCGTITLFLAATIAIVNTDIKRVLAYSTVSQLGYMMLALGVGGWVAGLFHLITHAFFKSLLFMCSGSVIHACHTNEMPKMGGLRHKMPYTAYTMLVGCLAIIGAGIPFVIGFSGYYSKDSIIEQALLFYQHNPTHGAVFFVAAAGGAAMTAFYMFRLWYLTFAGEPRDKAIYDHAHESPKVMYVPLVVLAVMAVGVGWRLPFTDLCVTNLLEQARPSVGESQAMLMPELVYPNEHDSHLPEIARPATVIAFSTALSGFLLATVFYGWKILNPADVRQQFEAIYQFLRHKWYFDELYNAIFIQPTHFISARIAWFDKNVIDVLIETIARGVRRIADLDDLIDRYLVDGLVNTVSAWTWSLGTSLKSVQTGRLRQYVMLLVIGTVALTVIIRWAVASG
ncbi:MAG: NADH-quinone oxidoreductase subunit L [Planctomycetaceae bacterium]|nr:NADH-quinone oxidoreductase subunit L [Planctomycetaceae bacterium]